MRLSAVTSFGLCCLWAGCQNATGYADAPLPAKLDTPTRARIAAEVAGALRSGFSPGTTTVAITRCDAAAPFHSDLELALRQNGYAVASGRATRGAVPLRCVIDRLGEYGMRVSVGAGERFETSWIYEVRDDGTLEPASAFTRRSETAVTRHGAEPARWGSLAALRVKKLPVSAAAGENMKKSPSGIAEVNSAGSVIAPAGPEAVSAAVRKPVGNPPPAKAPASTKDASTNPDAVPDAIGLSPNGEHTIEISSALLSAAEGAVPNPFLQQYRPASAARELKVTLSGIVLGPHPTAVVNERVCSLGERMGEFQLVGIQQDLVQLRWENFILRLPLQDAPVVVKYP